MTDDEKSFEENFEEEYPNTDLYFYFGTIRRPFDDYLIEQVIERKKKKNIMLFMTTSGGSPDAAYRIARCLQREYGIEKHKDGKVALDRTDREFYLFVDSFCVSAGTLVALGATKLILSDFSELGPLDIQIRKPDEPKERDSGLTPAQALTSLERRSKSLFKAHFDQLRNDTDLALTTRTAVDIAAKITSGLMGPIYQQIDPMRLGEVERLMEIAAQYGQRLGRFNVKSRAIPKLLTGYPSHSFVIDRREARDLFINVEAPKPKLRMFGENLRELAENKDTELRPMHLFYTPEAEKPYNENQEDKNAKKDSGGSRRSTTGKGKGDGKDGKGGKSE